MTSPGVGRFPDLGQDADGVHRAGRFDHPGQDQRPQRPIAETIQAELAVDVDLPQDQRGSALHHRRRPRAAHVGVTEIPEPAGPTLRRSPACSSTASSSSVWAEPICSRLSTRQPRLCTITTAGAPEAVFTSCTNTPHLARLPSRLAITPEQIQRRNTGLHLCIYKITKSLQLRAGQATVRCHHYSAGCSLPDRITSPDRQEVTHVTSRATQGITLSRSAATHPKNHDCITREGKRHRLC